MSARLRMPVVALAALSACLSIAIIGCAGRTINVFNVEQKSNAWLLPVWPNHFDTRELQALIGTSAAVLLLNIVLVVSLFVPSLPANLIILVSSILSTLCALVAIIFPTIINNQAPARDTLQSWTCRWSSTSISQGQGPPSQFNTVCQETRFAFYTTIPVFLVQLVLLSTAFLTLQVGRKGSARLMSDAEKGQGQHELGPVRTVSFESKSESPRSVQNSTTILEMK